MDNTKVPIMNYRFLSKLSRLMPPAIVVVGLQLFYSPLANADVTAPTISKTFGVPEFPVGGTTTLTFTLTNPNAVPLTGVSFSDLLPAGLSYVFGTPVSSCSAFSTNSTTTLFTFISGTLLANSSCNFTLRVTGLTAGVKVNTSSTLTSTEAPPSLNPATATVNVGPVFPPTISKSFGVPAFPLGGTTTLTFTLTNPNVIPLTGVNFTDTLPAGLNFVFGTIAATCPGFGPGPLTTASFTVNLATIPANASCTITISVLAVTPGVKVNTSSTLATNEAPTSLNPAIATVIVAIPPTISKSFGGLAVLPLNGVTPMTITITNPNSTTALSGVAVTDNFPTGLKVANPNGLVNTCGGTVTAVAGSGSVVLANGVIPISGTCTITVNVTGVETGLQTNTTGNVTSIEGGTDGTATDSITIGGNFLITYAANLTAGDAVINLTNTGANGASLTGPGFGGAVGNVCMNVYTFSPDEQLVSCCSCLVTPNGLASLSVNQDLISNTLTGVRPNSVVVKVVPTGAGAAFTGTSCTNSAATAGQNAANPLIVSGALGFGTTVHAQGTAFGTTENPLRQSTLSAQELASITSRCTNIIGNGSTFGICRSCRVGGLDASRL